jgi:hypothetical protein
VNEQQMYVRVGELATRVGYPMPAVERTTDPKVPAIYLKQGAVGPTMMLKGLTEELPPQVFDFLVTQDLVQAREGMHRKRWWFYVICLATGLLTGFASVGPFWVSVVVVLTACYLVATTVTIVARRTYLRRSDRLVVDVLGADDVRSALDWLADCQPWPKNLRWLWYGAVPPPVDRLRKLDLETA